jgi:hypothetical protein
MLFVLQISERAVTGTNSSIWEEFLKPHSSKSGINKGFGGLN